MELIRELNKPYQLFLDLDGVFADFDQHIKDLTGQYPHEFESKNKMWRFVEQYMADGNHFFGKLPMMSDAQYLWNHAKRHDPVFLTATGHIFPEEVARQKKNWVKQNITTQHDVITVRRSAMKQEYVMENTPSILIDDREKSIEPWIEAGGIGILHKNAVDSIKQLNAIVEQL